MASPFANYDINKDPTYRLAAWNRLTFQSNADKKLAFENDNVDIVKLSAIVQNLSLFNSDYIGLWNIFLARFLQKERSSNPAYYFISEKFAKLGILAKILNGQKTAIFMIIPPMLSQKWDEFYVPNFIGEEAFENIKMSPGTWNVDGFTTHQPVLKTYRDSSLHDNKTVGEIVTKIINGFTLQFQSSPVERLGYVAVFGVTTDINTDLLVVNVAYHISRQTFNTFGGFRTKILIKPKDAKTDYKKIFNDNVQKYISKVASIYTEPVLGLYVVPIPGTDRPLDLVDLRFEQNNSGFDLKIDPGSTRTGPIFLGSQIKLPSRETQGVSEVNCENIDIETLQDLADEFGIMRGDQDDDKKFCQDVKNAIQKKISIS